MPSLRSAANATADFDRAQRQGFGSGLPSLRDNRWSAIRRSPHADRDTLRRSGFRDLLDPAVELLDFPGLTRTPEPPASMAAKMYLGWKWISVTTGIGDFLAMAAGASASSCRGHATRTMSQPDAVSSAICCNVALTSCVRVVVMDCTAMG